MLDDTEKLPPHKKKYQMPSQSEKHSFYPILYSNGQNQTKTASNHSLCSHTYMYLYGPILYKGVPPTPLWVVGRISAVLPPFSFEIPVRI